MKRIAISVCMFLSALLVSSQVNTDRVMMIGKNAVVKVFVAKKDLEAAEEILNNISFDMPDNIDVGEEEK